MEITVHREKNSGKYQIKCYNCGSILTYDARDVHRNPGANKIVANHGFVGYDGEIRCPNCHTWLPHYLRNEMADDKLVVYTGDSPDVIVADGIKRIEKNAFYQERISSVKLPEGLESIGGKAFCETYIGSVVIPASVTEIESYAFFNCSYLTTVVFEGTPSIGVHAFSKCDNLKKIIIKSGFFPPIKEVFSGCYALEEIECPHMLDDFRDAVLREAKGRRWAQENKCAFCGGEFKGGLIKKCSVCGKKKSY